MKNVAKPNLVFFRYGRGENLVDFMQIHRQHHVQCLSEFFDVIVIQEDCDYQYICDKYQPELTMFEMLSGYEHNTCQKLKITNIRACPKIPKLGFHNADAWCEARAGFLSDMEHWGIETIFSICTTAAEHTPEIADNLFVWPNFIDANIYRDYGESKVIPVLFTGRKIEMYPWRQKIYKVVSEYYPALNCPHSGYSGRSVPWQEIYGEQYARTINASWFVPTCGTTAKEIVRKHFEIPASKSCLITEKSPALESAGFIDMQNCVFADEHDILDKLDYLFQHLDELEKITNAGYQLVNSRHTFKQRDQIFQWFNLYKNLKPNQNIVQTNPFELLTVVEKASGIKNSHIICNGLDIVLLQQGDEKLWAGKYDEAEALYLTSYNLIPWMPESKFRLALCNLYMGNAMQALEWIAQLIRYTLEDYEAFDPDPVQWAYFIISLLCLGLLDKALLCVEQFQTISHLELERVRLVVNFLKNENNDDFMLNSNPIKQRYSIHQFPEKSLKEWIDELCIMLTACKQRRFSKKLKNLALLEEKRLSQKNLLGDEIVLCNQTNRFDRETSSNSTEVALSLISQILQLENNNFSTKSKKKLKIFIKKNMIEFLKRYRKNNKKFFSKIQELLLNDLD